ncbi:MAG: SufD family Fe-S cluster assembly protein [Opitutales bacterium]|nr:SufD family Fe-S cluster assembly protein [Opitutales bacterium]
MKAFENFSRERLDALRLDENWRFSQFEKLLAAAGTTAPATTVDLSALAGTDFEIVTRDGSDRHIAVPAGTQKKMLEFIVAGTGEKTLTTEIEAGENATLERVVVQCAPREVAVLTADTLVAAGTGASIKTLFVNIGAAYTRSALTVCARAEHCFLSAQIVNCVAGTQIADIRTRQIHEVRRSVSRLLCKNVLRDSATTIFGGNIVVTPDGGETAATQSCNNLSLGDRTTAHAMPGLEIDANDVQCSHGATNSSLDFEQLFYLLQRGVPEAVARQMLVQAFVNQSLETVGDPILAEFLRERIF